MRIANNLASLSAFNELTRSNSAYQETLQQISSGLRINNASDDAAGLAISEKMRAQLSGLDTARRNTQDGISLLQTAEGALEAETSILQRMRELSVQASNDILTQQDRTYIQEELEQLKSEINRITSTAQFNKKKILDGSIGVNWSSSDNSLSVKVNGGISGYDEYGQKVNFEGNYELEIQATPGQAQVQKSNIMLTFTEAITGNIAPSDFHEININTGQDIDGMTSGVGWRFSGDTLEIFGDGNYAIVGTGEVTANHIYVNEGVQANIKLDNVNIVSSGVSPFEISGADVKLYLQGDNTLTASGSYEHAGLEVHDTLQGKEASIEINSINGLGSTEGKLTATGTGCGAGIGGQCHYPNSNPAFWNGTPGDITINGGTIIATAFNAGAGIGGGGYYHDYGDEAQVNITINGGDITATARGSGAGIGSGGVAREDTTNVNIITINGGKIKATGSGGGAAIGGGNGANDGIINIRSGLKMQLTGWIDTENGHTQPIGRGQGGIVGGGLTDTNADDKYRSEIVLRDYVQFYDDEGVFAIDAPQELTITQGDGKTATITVYAEDTMEEFRQKLNDAIAYGLGQYKNTDNVNNFASFVEPGTTTLTGSEAVNSTLLIRSVVPGKNGELTFSGSEALLNSLGFNTIQSSTESEFNVSIRDAHTREMLASDIKVTGNVIHGAISPNIDIEIDAMTNTQAVWDDVNKRYVEFSGNEPYKANLHLSDNTLMLQTGANEGEDFMLRIGDMSAHSLGVDCVNVMSRGMAARAITLIDEALDKVLTQRANIGSSENALEHTMSSLAISYENLTNSESRIRDTDTAKAMMIFTQLNIKRQSNIAMLAQANQLPQQVLSLLR